MSKPAFLILAILALAAALPSAAASLDLKTYEGTKDAPFMKTYLSGIGEGASWANAALVTDGKSPVYCEPKNVSLNYENYRQLLNTFVEKRRKTGAPVSPLMPVGATLVQALMEAFPCR